MVVAGYTSVTSVAPGRSIDFHLSADTSGRARLSIEKIGFSSAPATISVNLVPRPIPRMNAWEGYRWPVSTSFRIPANWPSGLYQLMHDGERVFTFVVRSATPGTVSKILFEISFLTPAAYNRDGGKSFYYPTDNALRARKVSLDRPQSCPPTNQTPEIFETKIIEWLENEGIDVEYCSSIDLHATTNLLDHYDCLLIGFHDEYWTKSMRDHCERFVGNGGNMIILSGNTCYRQVRLEDNDRTVVFQKFSHLDLDHPHAEEVAVAWTEPPVNRPQNSLLGVGFAHGAWRGRRTAYEIHYPKHWVFEGVSDSQTSAFMDYETDAADFVIEPEGYPRVTGEENTPLNTTVLASADNRHWTGKPGRATMTIYSRNGTVFNAATTDWYRGLATDEVDEVVAQITRNVFRRLGRLVPLDWEYVGHANRGSALTSLGGKIFLATTKNRLWRRYPVGADVPWTDIGHAKSVKSMASSGNSLFCITQDNRLWHRPNIEQDVAWSRMGTGITDGTNALAAAGGMLYAVGADGILRKRTANTVSTEWSIVREGRDQIEPNPSINALTSFGDILLASTTDNRLLRTNTDWINESDHWQDIHHCNFSIGLAVIESTLYVVTTENAIWRMDLTRTTTKHSP